MKKKAQKNKKAFKESYLLLPVLLLVVVLLTVTLINLYLRSELSKTFIVNSSLDTKKTEFPVLSTDRNPYLTAQGAIVMDDESKKIIFSKNEDVRFSPASTTKVLTALTALSHFDSDDILTVTDESVDSVVGIKMGERYRFEDLLYAMMLPSDNRAAFTVAQNYPGGMNAFVTSMNEVARSLNLHNTGFGDPAGLLDDMDYITPRELAYLASFAIKNEKLNQVASTKNVNIKEVNTGRIIELENLNVLLGVDGIVGLKTGHTDLAGDVLVTTQRVELDSREHTLIIVVMGSEDRFYDTREILAFLEDNIRYLTIHP